MVLTIAYTGYDEEYLGYQSPNIYIMNTDGSDKRMIETGLNRSPGNLQWSANGEKLYMQFVDEGIGKVASVTMDGEVTVLANNVGGTSIGRPYSSGSYSVANDGSIAYTYSEPTSPADVAVDNGTGDANVLTQLNEELFAHKKLGQVQEIWYESSHDGKEIQGWVVTPPNFDPDKKYPMILEIHGGPFASYGPHFSTEIQLYAAAGYVVLYTNPRGSSSYGEAFANEIHHNYPSNDYDDLMSGVDAVI
ncbi:MAG: prolyl oligopeptidase family serine peptidase [Fodinibius sp.]|nr:prolyl oligopeptidase family serine peptidase [Fodinibius sp.]